MTNFPSQGLRRLQDPCRFQQVVTVFNALLMAMTVANALLMAMTVVNALLTTVTVVNALLMTMTVVNALLMAMSVVNALLMAMSVVNALLIAMTEELAQGTARILTTNLPAKQLQALPVDLVSTLASRS
jgi:hypothetical protein